MSISKKIALMISGVLSLVFAVLLGFVFLKSINQQHAEDQVELIPSTYNRQMVIYGQIFQVSDSLSHTTTRASQSQ